MKKPLPEGTGKTATFAVSILQKIDASMAECQALVLAPTRELAQQIVKVVRALGDFMQLQVSGWIDRPSFEFVSFLTIILDVHGVNKCSGLLSRFTLDCCLHRMMANILLSVDRSCVTNSD